MVVDSIHSLKCETLTSTLLFFLNFVLSCRYTSDFLLAMVMQFFQVLSRGQHAMKITSVGTLELPIFFPKLFLLLHCQFKCDYTCDFHHV